MFSLQWITITHCILSIQEITLFQVASFNQFPFVHTWDGVILNQVHNGLFLVYNSSSLLLRGFLLLNPKIATKFTK